MLTCCAESASQRQSRSRGGRCKIWSACAVVLVVGCPNQVQVQSPRPMLLRRVEGRADQGIC
jgi:hypothetical protein